LRQGIEELYKAYSGAGLSEAEWKGSRYYRLPTVKDLQARGMIDETLRRVGEHSSQP
jgi:hypothetical protein